MEKLFDGDYNDCVLLATDDLRSIKKIRDLKPSEVAEIIESNYAVHELIYYERRLEEVYSNYNDLLKTIEGYSEKIAKLDIVGTPEVLMEEIYINVNRTFTNFISSFVNFVDDIEEKRYGGKDGGDPRYSKFHKITSEAYDNFFSYRLFYKLRNYALHYFFPINNFKKTPVANEAGNSYLSQLEIYFDRDEILRGNFIKGSLRTELAGYNKIFPIKFTVAEILKPLHMTTIGFFGLEKPFFMEHAPKIMKYTKVSRKNYKVSVAKKHAHLSKFDTLELPVRAITRLNSKMT